MDYDKKLQELMAAKLAGPKTRKPKTDKKAERAERERRNSEWSARAMAAIRARKPGVAFSANDLAEYLGEDRPRYKNAWGQVFTAAQTAGLIKPTGETVKSLEPRARGRAIKTWYRLVSVS